MSKETDEIILIDTHCHIHDSEFSERFKGVSPDDMIENAKEKGVKQLICVGTDIKSSQEAIEFSSNRAECHASVAIHPHEAADKTDDELRGMMSEIIDLASNGEDIIAIGETGLDYFYHDDSQTHNQQEKLLRMHLELAQKLDLPVIFHIRDPKNTEPGELGHAFSHFFKIIDDYKGITGVMHSFSAGIEEMEGAVKRGFYIGLNGIMTFAGEGEQLDAARAVPLDKLVVETDAPFLTPAPFRGTMCEPKYVRVTAEFLSKLRSEDFNEFAKQTTANATNLFRL